MPVEEARWYNKQLDDFRASYVSYASSVLDFRHIFDDRSTLRPLDSGLGEVDTGALSSVTSYLTKVRGDGILLLEVCSFEEFVNVVIYAIDMRRLARILRQSEYNTI